MDNKTLLQIAQFICNKEQTTNIIGIDQFNQLLPLHVIKFVKDKAQEYISLSEWERAEKINLTFQNLKKLYEPCLLDDDGFANLPNDFLMVDAITFTQSINGTTKVRKVDECSGSEFMYRQTSPLKRPTDEHPIIQIIGNKIQCLPLTNDYLNFQYIRKPATPYLDWTVDADNNIVYKAAGAQGSSTVEIELLDEDKLSVLAGILKDIGLNIGRNDIVSYANDYLA